jgi:adenine deaminase
MWVMVRQGSAARNLAELLPLAAGANGERMMLVTDDRHPDDLLRHGELDDCVRLAVAGGLAPVAAVRMVTYGPAQYFGLVDRGLVAPGRLADLWLVSDLREFATAAVVRHGVVTWDPDGRSGAVVVDGAGVGPLAAPAVGNGTGPMANSVHLPPELSARVGWEARSGCARVIGLVEDQIVTRHLEWPVTVRSSGEVPGAPGDAAKLAVIHRHGRANGVGLGIVSGFNLRCGALASTVAHDSHNLIVAAADDRDLLAAAEELARCGGGFAVASQGRILARLALPVAGLMADLPAAAVARELGAANQAAASLGCRMASPFMTLSFLALPVIPALKLTDRGLVDVGRFELVDMWKEQTH